MFKWFRKYNKQLLAFFAAGLMIAFLMPVGIRRGRGLFGGAGSDVVIGHIGSEEVYLGQQHQAARDIDLVVGIFGSVHQVLGIVVKEEPHRWLLMKLEAQRMGISTGDPEVASLLAALKVDPDEQLDDFVARLTAQYDITENHLYTALGDWLTIEKYKDLVRGQTHTPVRDRLVSYIALLSRIGQLQKQLGPEYHQMVFEKLWSEQAPAIEMGEPRISEPLIQRFIADVKSELTISTVPVSHAVYLSKIAQPSEERLAELFGAYKSSLPGKGEPYAVGYKYPDRVKIEFIAVPFSRVTDSIHIEEADAVKYYDLNAAQFMHEPAATQPAATAPAEKTAPQPATQPAKPVLKPYKEVREEIISQLSREQAQEKIGQIIHYTQQILAEDASSLASAEGYRVEREGWKPVSLDVVASRVQARYSILPDVVRIDDRWLDREEFSKLEGLGRSMVTSQRGLPTTEYLFSARELKPDPANPLLALKLQAHLPSLPLADPANGSRYVVRILDAQPSHEPASLGEVRDHVVEDARKIAAYELLIADKPNWTKRLESESLEDMAKALEVKVTPSQPFPRRQILRGGGTDVLPVTGVGADPAFVDAAYVLADAQPSDDPSLSNVPAAKRSAAIASARNLTLYLVRLDKYEPVTLSRYQELMASRRAGTLIHQAMLGNEAPDPLSVEAISKRLNYQPVGGKGGERED